ncbi:hypothetical protein SEA_ANNIHILUS_3 [Streptomyces phage Annihilus]|jgi:hypothetical protein|nr:hypothetical protein SEA_MOOZY_3 [Streptomyces phage Moozy]UQT02450.1 hypothetical protein SEA_ANNIHILUS_3 [Streptomyces phage Annihilus]WMI34383.1 hypothetical protein SEA_SHERA_3 [Streptomyces phage SheRa]
MDETNGPCPPVEDDEDNALVQETEADYTVEEVPAA